MFTAILQYLHMYIVRSHSQITQYQFWWMEGWEEAKVYYYCGGQCIALCNL